MINIRRLNAVIIVLLFLGLSVIVGGEISGNRSIGAIAVLLVLIPVKYPSLCKQYRKKDLELMTNKYGWLWGKAFVTDKRKNHRFLLVLGYLELDKPGKALRIINKLKSGCDSRADYTRILIAEGMCFMAMKQYQKAQIQFDDILVTESAYATVWGYQAINNLALGDTEAAQKACERSFLYNAKNVWGYIGLSLVSLTKGQYENALMYALDAQKRNEAESMVLVIIACCYLCMGENEKRWEYLNEYTSAFSNELPAYPILALKKAKRYGIAFRLRR